jgi:hypothetical protein
MTGMNRHVIAPYVTNLVQEAMFFSYLGNENIIYL